MSRLHGKLLCAANDWGPKQNNLNIDFLSIPLSSLKSAIVKLTNGGSLPELNTEAVNEIELVKTKTIRLSFRKVIATIINFIEKYD